MLSSTDVIDTNLSLASTIMTSIMTVEDSLSFSIQALISGASPNGVLQLVGSNLTAGDPAQNYIAVAGTQYTWTVSGAGQYMFEYANCGFKRARLLWTPGGGSVGLLSAYGFIKQSV